MYLKQLVLKGFKSFADRSVLSFEPGITAVVGPNGSGKSNISDSVLWVLGERNAKNLRGQAMEDVIFAGSSARKPVGVAEVDLVLDNTDGTLPVDFTEVAITRRMYRNGQSEYLINGTIARRMDVLDILHDSGLGTGTHSIISQGHLSGILQSKPEDRRALIEEAAGVLKHKQRKAKSERKLERMDDHLARVQDVLAEVERQVRPLERKAKRALAFREVSAQLAELKLQLAVDDLRILQRTWDGTLASEEGKAAELEQLRARIEEAEQQAEALQVQLASESATSSAAAARHRRAQGAADKLDSNIMLLHEKKRSTASYLTEMRLQLQNDVRQVAELSRQLDAATEQLETATAAREAADAALAQARQRTEALQAKKRELQQKFDEASARRRDAMAELETVRAAAARTQEILASNRAQEKLIDTHAAELEGRLQACREALRAAEDARDKTEADLENARAAEAAAREQAGVALTARDEARAAADAARDERAAASAAVAAATEAEVARTAGNAALAAAQEAASAAGAGERLLDELKAADEVEALVEVLLGADLEALFVADAASATQVAQHLAQAGATGAATVLARTGMRGGGVLAPAGTRRLIDMIECTPASQAAADALLGDVVICDSAEAAQQVACDFPGVVAATLDGVVAWPNGKLTFARKAAGANGALAAHRALEQARERLEAAQAASDAAQQAATSAEEALRAAQSAQMSAGQAAANLRGTASAAQQEARRAKTALEAVEREAAQIEAQRATARDALAAAEPEAASLEERARALTAAIDDAKDELDRTRDELSPVRAQADEAQNALAEAKLAAATAKERTDYAVRMKLARTRDIETARAAVERAEGNIARKETASVRIDPLLSVIEGLASAARNRTQRLEEESAASSEATAALHEKINAARAQAKEAHDAFDAANERLGDVRVEKGRLEMQVEAAIHTITDDCKTPLEVALKLPELEGRPAIEEQVFKLQRRIDGMGAINPEAAAEYEQLKTRYDFLRSQVDDMLTARRSLQKIVHIIDERMKDDFVNTFEEVNRNFKDIFATLFPGGKGSLTLVDPADPENTGVEVNAQPSGKRILKMSLMSGGEQSLTALALLFAVYRTRSTPFYILDEVEAALDDTNLRRLTAYLDSIRDHTQFIMITHQRRTMEMADVLYGISMQSDGVTRVMSQRLDKALRYAEG